MTAAEVNAALLCHLKTAGVRSTLFFTVGDGTPERLALARAWGEAGHGIANHTVSHPSLHGSKTTLQVYCREIVDCDAVISGMPGYTKRFRFTYLKEGNTEEKRDGVRTFLKAQGYQAAPVSIDASDWYHADRMSEHLKLHPHADLGPWREAYLDHL